MEEIRKVRQDREKKEERGRRKVRSDITKNPKRDKV